MRKIDKTLAAMGITAALAIGGIAYFGTRVVGGSPPSDDIGIKFCDSIAARSAQNNDNDISAKDFQRLRDYLDKSRYKEIKEPGMKFLTIVEQVQKLPDDDFSVMAYVGPAMSAYVDLSVGCAKHGHPLPPPTGA